MYVLYKINISNNIISLPLFLIILLLGTVSSESDKIHPLAHSSGSSILIRDSFVKISLEKSIFRRFLTQYWRFKIFALLTRVWKKKKRVLVKSGCFSINRFSLEFPRGDNFLKFFFLCFSLWTYIFNSRLYRSMISKKILWYVQCGHCIRQITLLFSVFKHMLNHFH